jgi:hypothetical protein
MAAKPLLAAVRDRLKARPDSEHEQALIRVAIATAVLLYFIVVDIAVGHVTQGLIVASGFPPGRAGFRGDH